MQISDQSLWQQQVAALMKTDQGKAFLGFVENWLDCAEAAMGMEDLGVNCAEALRLTLSVPEEKFGRKTIGEVGHCLVVALGHWQYREQLADELTAFEQRLVQDIVAANIALQQERAAECSNSDAQSSSPVV